MSISINNTHNKIFMRFRSLVALQQVFVVPAEYIARLSAAHEQAIEQSNHIQERVRLMCKLSNVPPGTQLVRTDTGEIIAEAERILNGNSGYST